MKNTIKALVLVVAVQTSALAQIASDNASNYLGVWTNGSTGGTGFSSWTFESATGTGFSGAFIGNPSAAEITGMNADSFALYANPENSGAYVKASRNILTPLTTGMTFSFQMGMNWDSGSPTGNKGFNLYSGGFAGAQLLNINMSDSPTISMNSTPILTSYGKQAMDFNISVLSLTSIRVFGTGRDGVEAFDQVITVSSVPDAFAFYSSGMMAGDNRQIYFNELTVVPEPTSLTLTIFALGLGLGFCRRSLLKQKAS